MLVINRAERAGSVGEQLCPVEHRGHPAFQVARRVEAKVRQERPGRDKVVRRAGLQRARFGSDEAGSAQIIGQVARNLPSKNSTALRG